MFLSSYKKEEIKIKQKQRKKQSGTHSALFAASSLCLDISFQDGIVWMILVMSFMMNGMSMFCGHIDAQAPQPMQTEGREFSSTVSSHMIALVEGIVLISLYVAIISGMLIDIGHPSVQ